MIAGRYLVEAALGEGGTARVYRVHDISTDRRLALKRSAGNVASSRQLFEREYYTLRQFAHPAIIEVYDFGIDNDVPFYTMELLTGADLAVDAPLDWQKAVALLLPIVSSLAVLHSRRLLHRDVSATNVRRNAQGHAKLIDFGAMTEVGMPRQLVGTVAYVPPEAVNQQPLDPRLDLYAVGALLYRLLTGQDAYPAQTFRELQELWYAPLPSVRDWNEAVPEALSQLVSQLLALEPIGRPNSAAEVMERLSAISGLPMDESVAVRQAYLTTPKLVGRDAELRRVHEHIQAAREGRGGALLIKGVSGVGRSRLLDACVLDAKLAGLVVLRTDAADGSDFGVARALLEQLSQALPEAARTAPAELSMLADAERARAARPQLQAALRAWLLGIADQHGLMLAVDDLHLVDEPSAALLALLASQAQQHRLALSITLCSDALPTSLKATALIGAAARALDLVPLAAPDSEALLRSVFGEVPRVRLLADRLHKLSEGSPRALMDLGQHLVAQGVVRYESGTWRIPDRFDANALPERVQQALQVRIDVLSPDARLLADALALSQGVHFSHEEYVSLAGLGDHVRLHAALDELIAGRLLQSRGDHYTFQQNSWAELLRRALSVQRAGVLHRRLAEVLGLRSDEPLLTALHLLAAGDDGAALDAITALSIRWINREQSAMQNHRYVQMTMSDDFTKTLEAGLALFDKHARPRYERHAVQLALLFAAVHGHPELTQRYLATTAQQLRLDSGLCDFDELAVALEPSVRVREALGLARARYASTPKHEQVFAPSDAIKYLIRLVHSVAALAAAQNDRELLQALPSVEPLLAVSPALSIARQNVEVVDLMLSGRHFAAIALYERIVARLDEPDLAGHEPTLHKYVRLAIMYASAQCEAGLGLESALRSAKVLESDPLHELNALRVRANYYLTRGAAQRAEECRQRLELLQIQNAPAQFFEGYDVFRYLPGYAAADDLANLKRSLDTIEALAKRSAGWVPLRHYVAGEYARVRGDNAAALVCFARAVEGTGPGRHQVWAHAAEQYLYALLALGRAAEAVAIGRAWADAWEREDLVGAVGVAFAAALAELGDHAAALARLEVIIARWKTRGVRGVQLGRAYELAARAARATQQDARFEAYLTGCREEYTYGETATFLAKVQRLF
jgi:hypothetical protein